jgi:hypothetical protein
MARAFQFDVGPVVEQLNRILQMELAGSAPRCRRKIEMSPGVQSRDDTPVGESPRSASLRASRQ